jgi:hypothetical protein
MTHPTPITIFDHLTALAKSRRIHPGSGCDAPITGGCGRCHAAITSHDAYYARFAMARCRDCIGNDGFATVDELELFADTETLPCNGCGQPAPPAEESPDGYSFTYHCRSCGTTAHYTMQTVA